jgi:hypothetical protein
MLKQYKNRGIWEKRRPLRNTPVKFDLNWRWDFSEVFRKNKEKCVEYRKLRKYDLNKFEEESPMTHNKIVKFELN